MPQDIPLEASSTLAFTPDCLKLFPKPPCFTLRASTYREDEHVQRLSIEEGMVRHSLEEERAAMLAGLKANWSAEAYEQHSPIILEYWQASDQHDQEVTELRKAEPDIAADDPRLKFEYDEQIVEAIVELIANVEQSYPPLRRLHADNAMFGEKWASILAATMIANWSGLETKVDLDRGYLSMACVHAVKRELFKLCTKHGIPSQFAWTQLAGECAKRFRLEEEEAGNSASPSLSSESPQPSKSKATRGDGGKFPASASSAKTPETA